MNESEITLLIFTVNLASYLIPYPFVLSSNAKLRVVIGIDCTKSWTYCMFPLKGNRSVFLAIRL